jgi:hypothetical protein
MRSDLNALGHRMIMLTPTTSYRSCALESQTSWLFTSFSSVYQDTGPNELHSCLLPFGNYILTCLVIMVSR